ncbi:hypothetical protein LY90DRAFT_665481 [Neocallimastix californiae]|uniref:CBM21 domain-containing protein n=1 Tax=Neocallimastix californiae TaxID=1754190 RepID=A0A1Y2EYT6_9FUNG|nr:hypothetical protein LY90DRAFT_665481 [Neocallimastix californiae]|eukprot:ORY76759.1 hypothetical protein LY90DRAFT_665481 [Neocallimastix californiae]
MYKNNFSTTKNNSIASETILDFLYNNSLDNSYIDNRDLYKMNNSFNTNNKSQIDKTIVGNENLRRKDSAIELEGIKNSYSDTEYTGFEKSKNPKKSTSGINNNKVEFIVDDDDSSEEDSEERLIDNDTIFNLEIESLSGKEQHVTSSSISSSLSSTLMNSSSNVPNLNTNKNLSLLTQNIKNFNNRNISHNPNNSNFSENHINKTNLNSNNAMKLNNNFDSKTNSPSNLLFQKMINYHLNNENNNALSSSLKTNKIKFGNQTKDLKLKESPIKYNGLDILKPILKKKSAYSLERKALKFNLNEGSETKLSISSSSMMLRKEKNTSSPIKKNVHFKNENEECPFKKFECPSNIVNLPIYVVDSQLEPFLEVKLVKLEGFPTMKKISLPQGKNVILESVGLIDDETQEHDIVRLNIQVRNIAFEKKVKVHYSFDNWKTVKIENATYHSSEINECKESIDKFILKIDTDRDEEEESVTHLQFAIQYQVHEQDFWDNNDEKNYSLRIDRIVRIPAKAIKSHRYCEGPVVRYKLKPGYHYPLFKSNINEHPSADILEEEKEEKIKKAKEIKDQNVVPLIQVSSLSSSLSSSPQKNTIRFSVERNTLENIISSDDNNFSSSRTTSTPSKWIDEDDLDEDEIIEDEKEEGDEEEKEENFENSSNKDVFSWNEPILLRKSGFKNQNQSQNQNLIQFNSKFMKNSIKDNSHSSFEAIPSINKIKKEEEEKKKIDNSNKDIRINSNPKKTSSNLSSPSPSPSPSPLNNMLNNTFKLPKHENWFKEAPSCIPFGSSPRKLYHPSNNFKHTAFSKSLFDSKSQNQVISEKEKKEEEENKKRLNSKYSFSTHLSSSSSKYMRNGNSSYGNYQSLYHLYNYSSSPSLIFDQSNPEYEMNSTHHSFSSNNNFFSHTFNNIPTNSSPLSSHPTTSTTANINKSFAQNYMKSYVSSTPSKERNIYGTSHLYATQEDFISDNLSYF